MRVKITEDKILLQPENPQEVIEICGKLNDGSHRSLRVDSEAVARAINAEPVPAAPPVPVANLAATAAPVPLDPIDLTDRKAIRARLDAMGIEYNNRWGTERLAAFLGEKTAPVAPLSEESAFPRKDDAAADPLADPAPAAVASPVDKNAVLVALKGIITTKGKEEGTPLVKKILSDHGATNISGIKEEDYASVLKAAQGVS